MLSLGGIVPAWCCTSIIISSKFTSDGRPVMYKNRDTGKLDNRMQYFKGPLYTFIGLVNSDFDENEVWAGTNSAGFCIMNTAAYNFKEDKVPDSKMDKEGVLMFKALGLCKTVADFEKLLDTLQRPMGVEANFGVIDSHGGAAYYEVNNTRWIKIDVNEDPSGYRVVTNFCSNGRKEDYKGYERYLTASAIMSEMCDGKSRTDIGHSELYNCLSRSYRNVTMGVDFDGHYDAYASVPGFTGFTADQDFIPRLSTSAAVVFEGVVPETDPSKTVMWSLIGYPSCSVSIPLVVGKDDCIPSYMKRSSDNRHSQMGDIAMRIKNSFVFPKKVSNGSRYVNVAAVLRGDESHPSLVECCRRTESFINNLFTELYEKWENKEISDAEFYSRYRVQSGLYYEKYRAEFSPFIE